MGVQTALIPLAKPLFDLIDDLFTSDDEREAAKLKLLQADLKPLMSQLEINKTEAASTNWFVAGWRPFIGWTCGFIFFYAYVLRDILIALAIAGGIDVSTIPDLNLYEVMPVMLGMLGLGAARSYEKVQGAEANR
ncbi:3TM-type holin [Shimia sp.]|uniref:3TM-type holin n=1 Tax=Shimia sp. TaxID=1954381 RepID=UPI003BABEDAD